LKGLKFANESLLNLSLPAFKIEKWQRIVCIKQFSWEVRRPVMYTRRTL
jgi:hypothetical protein